MSRSVATPIAGVIFVSFLLAACGGDTQRSSKQDVGTAAGSPQILAFAAAPGEVQAGDAVKLWWRTADAATLSLVDGDGNTISLEGIDVASGSVEVTPATTTTFTLTATGTADQRGPVWRSVQVTVIPGTADAPVIEAFAASAPSVAAGGEVTLSWRTSNAARLTLKDDVGASFDVSALSRESGELAVRPTRSPTTYVLTATGPGGRATAEVSVELLGVPRVTRFFVEPREPVSVGVPATLVWETQRTSRVVIRDAAGETVVDSTSELSGSREVSVDRTTRFTITATGSGGEASAEAMVEVGPTIDAFSSSLRVVRAGDPVTFSWRTGGADEGALEGPGGYHLALSAAEIASGEAVVNVAERGDFRLIARRGTTNRTWSIFLEVTEAPRVRSLVVDRAIVTAAADRPATVNVSWVQDGGTSCSVFANNVPAPGLANFPCAGASTVAVPVTGPTVFKLVAVNHAGSHSATVQVDAVAPARIPVFTKTPTRRLTPGTSVSLAWTVTDAVSVRLEKDGLSLGISPTAFTGTLSDVVDLDATYALTAENALGDVTVSELAVSAGAPVIGAFASTPPVGALGETVTLAWTCDGGDDLVLLDPAGAEVLVSADPAVIDGGSAVVVLPATPGLYTYTLRVTNDAGGSDERALPIQVSDGPMIRSFTTSKTVISLGQTVTLGWLVSDDAAGADPTLALVDGFGETWPVAGKNPNADAITLAPLHEGQTVFTLTASTPGTVPSTATVVVEVGKAPIVDAFAADPTVASSQGGQVVPTVTLTWATQNAVELSVWELDATGAAIPPALLRLQNPPAAQASLDAGSLVVHPTATTSYLLRIKNRIGTVLERNVKVVVDPPEVVRFLANPPEIILGETAHLEWTTANAASVRLDPPTPAITRLGNTYVDVSSTGTKSSVSGDSAVATIPFPAGFTFPFGGADRTSIQVSTNGWAGFSTTNSSSDGSPSAFPVDGKRHVNLALFWCDLDNTKGSPAGELWYGMASDAAGDMFVVQWKNWSWWSSSYNPSNLNFELILRPNGNFEFRYGAMSASTANRAAGEGCGIGFQLPQAGSFGMNVTPHNLPVGGGVLAGTGWAFDLGMPLSGTKGVTPSKTTTYTLTAINPDATDDESLELKVWTVPVVNLAAVIPSAPEATVPFKIEWKTTGTTQVRVLDRNGNEICKVTDPARLAVGFCTHVEPVQGNYSYTVEAINGLARNVATRTANAGVFPLLALDQFAASANFVSSGTEITLTWAARGAFEAALYECVPKTNRGQCTPIDISALNPNGGSITRTLTASKEFWFQAVDQMYRSRDGFVNVWVDAPDLTSFTAGSTQIPAGSGTTLNWTSTGSTKTTIKNAPLAEEVTASKPFIDVSAAGQGGTQITVSSGSTTSTYYTLNFPAGFTFPYFGTVATGARIFASGWLSFDTTTTTTRTTNYALPNTSYGNVHLAPWWDFLAPGTAGQVWWAKKTDAEGEYLVIQWKNYTYSGNTSNLNFEVILRANGNVEYRYGAMTSSTATYSDGTYATVAYQTPGGSAGGTLNHNTPFPGGIQHRSFALLFNFPGSGSLTVNPGDSTTYEVCVTNASLYEDCQSVRVVVVKPGDVLFTELMVAPATDDAEWVEVRNTAVDPIRLDGWVLSSGAETYTIPAGVTLQPGAFAVLARSGNPAVNGIAAPAHVYGSALQLADATDDVALTFAGVLIDRVTWTGTWGIEAGKSLSLEPSVMARNHTVNDVSGNWCKVATVYGGGFVGSPGTTGPGCLTSGGYQYYLLDSASSKPFIDIAATGNSVSSILPSTYYTAPIDIGFPFPYFGDTATTFSIGRHGYLALAPVTDYYSSNSAIPAASTQPNGLIAPFWDYLYYTTGVADIRWESRTVGGQRVMIVQWEKLASGSTSYGIQTFQTQLWENGDIVFSYPVVTNTSTYTYWSGANATVGLENLAGTQAIQIYYGTSSSAVGPIYQGRTFHFVRR